MLMGHKSIVNRSLIILQLAISWLLVLSRPIDIVDIMLLKSVPVSIRLLWSTKERGVSVSLMELK